MARRTNPHAHDWLSFVEVSGLLVSEPVLHAHFPQGPEGVSRPTVQALRGAWERFQVDPADSRRRVIWLDTVVFGLLEIPKAKWHRGASLPLKAVVTLDWADQPLRPAAVLEGPEGELALGFWSVAPGQGFDRVEKVSGRWRQTPQVKLEAWLRKTGTPFGLLTNGRAFRLLHVPPGLPTAWIEFDADLWFEEKAVLDAFYTLLRAQRWFGAPEQRLSALVRESAERQADLTDSLGVQVRQAVERLILAIDRQDQAAGGRILASVPADDLYRAAVYAVMRLVFLLFAEERGLLPHGVVFFDDGYGLGRLLKTLEDERRERPDTFRREADAWPRLLALFRLVFYGSTHPDLPLPAYGGDLFDPRAFQAMTVLEHPDLRIPNADVYAILRALTHGTAKIGREAVAQRYSYRTLDVEHIGYLYEGLLDHRAARAGADPMVKFAGAGEAAYPLSALEGLSPEEVVEYAATRGALKGDRTRIRERLEHPDPADQEALNRYAPAVARRCRPYASIIQVDEVVEPGRLYLTTSASRRATGTHYTPIQYTRAMVAETLEPLVYVGAHGRPEEPKRLRPPRQLLDLKVCDPAMGSGAFLVQVVRYLAERLVDAWWAEREKHPPGTPLYLPFAEPVPDREERVPLPDEREEALVWARRFVAERCVYGVDANPLAVEMAKLSLWLVTLARDKPFSFLDHALRCGDSLVGVCRAEDLADWRIRSAPPAERPVNRPILADRVRSRMEDARRLRLELEAFSVRAPADVRAKERLHRQAQDRVEELRTWADLLTAATLDKASAAELDTLLERLLAHQGEPAPFVQEARDRLRELRPFHWPLEFPEVFGRENPGFDAIVGNPPFMGGQKITGRFGEPYRDYLVQYLARGKRGSADLASYFFLRAFVLLREGGNFGLLAVNTIAEGDTRQVGLEQLLKWGATIYSAHPNEPWPSDAAVVTSRVHVHRGPWKGERRIRGVAAPHISAFLSDREEWSPKRLKANEGISFIGSYVLGKGFLLTEEEALALIEKDPRNRDVLFPYLNGQDLNSHPEQKPSRWVINFWDWPEERARTYPEPYRIVRERVKPERQRLNESNSTARRRKRYWWLFGSDAKTLYHAIGRGHAFERHPEGWDQESKALDRVLATARVTKTGAFSFVPNRWIYSEQVVIFATSTPGFFALLQSSVHEAWARKLSSSLETRLRYTPTDVFEVFPLLSEKKISSLSVTGGAYDRTRAEIMGTARIGLTDLYNKFHDPHKTDKSIEKLRDLHRQIDEAVAEAYGWTDIDLDHDFHEVPYLPENDRIRFTISERARREILRRLAELNRERYEEEVAQGLHDRKPAKPRLTKPKAKVVPFRPPEGRRSAPTPRQPDLFEMLEPGYSAASRTSIAAARGDDPPLPLAADRTDHLYGPAQTIRDWLTRNPGWHSRADILAGTGLPQKAWNQAIQTLLASGAVEKSGQKRGTKYRVRR